MWDTSVRRWTRRIPPVSHACANGRAPTVRPDNAAADGSRAPRIRRPGPIHRVPSRRLPLPTAAIPVRLRDVAAQPQALASPPPVSRCCGTACRQPLNARPVRPHRLNLLRRRDQRLNHLRPCRPPARSPRRLRRFPGPLHARPSEPNASAHPFIARASGLCGCVHSAFDIFFLRSSCPSLNADLHQWAGRGQCIQAFVRKLGTLQLPPSVRKRVIVTHFVGNES